MLTKSLQRPEESIRKPQAIDDEYLLSETDNTARLNKAEVDPKTLMGMLDAITSQIRQMNWGTQAGKNWTDVPADYIQNLMYNLGNTTWKAGENITKGQVLYSTTTEKEVKIASNDNSDCITVVGLAMDTVSTGSNVRVLHSGHILDGFTVLQMGKPYYLGLNGGLTYNVPSTTGDIVLRMGVAHSVTEFLIGVGEPRQKA